MDLHIADGFTSLNPFPQKVILTLLAAVVLLVFPAMSAANSDVYDSLPVDIQVVTYSLGDYDGDGRKELAVLYSSSEGVRLTLFSGDTGKWSKLNDVTGPLKLPDGTVPRFMESADITDDGKEEIFAYYLTEQGSTMVTRIFLLKPFDTAPSNFEIILEDKTFPAGYPLIGEEGGKPSVTFMRMATTDMNGYRRVHCWNGEAFEKCKEVVWKKP